MTDDFRQVMSSGEFEARFYDAEGFPDKVKVEGPIYLFNIVGKPNLPNDLIVQGPMTINNCRLDSLPRVLQVDGSMSIHDSKISICPESLSVKGSLCLEGLTSIESIKPVEALFYISDCVHVIGVNSVIVHAFIPHTIIAKLSGHRIEELVDHWILDLSSIRGRVIKSACPGRYENKIVIELEP